MQFYWQIYFDLNVHNKMQFVIVVSEVKFCLWTGTKMKLVSEKTLIHENEATDAALPNSHCQKWDLSMKHEDKKQQWHQICVRMIPICDALSHLLFPLTYLTELVWKANDEGPPGTHYIFPLNREAGACQTLQADNTHQTNHGNTSTGSPD